MLDADTEVLDDSFDAMVEFMDRQQSEIVSSGATYQAVNYPGLQVLAIVTLQGDGRAPEISTPTHYL